ncbi:MAG TPA: hydroxymethylglutaryl-CoA synthase family protein [Myxococcaceae bacterium]|nr:hydroxymethylglutaryl-CoA synthase family protein [Myxococcaceae bacterium]
MKTSVGIEALAVALPRRTLHLDDLARARGVDPAKYIAGLGVREMAVADPGEDTVALASTAARRLIEANQVDPATIGFLAVGTETGVDHSKPVASFVQGLVGLPRHMRVFDVQHACYGGTAALMGAAEWIASGVAGGKSAIVICSDIARYGVKTAGEPTQGAGAVAMLVSARPDLLSFDLGLNGTSSTHVFDFWRPLGRREAVVDGHYSIDCYLEALAGAYRDWRAKAEARELVRRGASALPSEQLAALAYHVPFCKMAKKAHGRLRRCDLDDVLGAFDEGREEREAASSFERQVAHSLTLCARVGNVYTGSLYLGLAGMLQEGAAALAGKRIGLFSYGSGCASEFFSGVVGTAAAGRIQRAKLNEVVGSRERITVDEYERLMALAPDRPPEIPPPPGGFRFTGMHEHRRQYASG